MITIHNDKPRRDREGKIVDAHEPDLKYFEGRFYFYGTGYANNNGWTPDNVLNCYSSADLETWEHHGALTPPGRQVAPRVVRRRTDGKYVLWFGSPGSDKTVALSDHPAGPFEIQADAGRLAFTEPEFKTGDFEIFVPDDDGPAYIIYAVRSQVSEAPEEQHRIHIERLTDDLTRGAGEVTKGLGWNCESPILFTHNGLYYALFDITCCWCPAGTGLRVYTAEDVFGEWTYRGDINRDSDLPPCEIPYANDDSAPGDGRPDLIIPMQTRSHAWVPTPEGPRLILIGDRWQSAPDGVKGHDFTYWTSPIDFLPDGSLPRLQWENHWTLTLAPP